MHLWVIVIFRFVQYLLNMIYLNFDLYTSLILELSYNSDTVYINFDRTNCIFSNFVCQRKMQKIQLFLEISILSVSQKMEKFSQNKNCENIAKKTRKNKCENFGRKKCKSFAKKYGKEIFNYDLIKMCSEQRINCCSYGFRRIFFLSKFRNFSLYSFLRKNAQFHEKTLQLNSV